MRTMLQMMIVLRPHNVAAALLSVAVGFAMTGSVRWPYLMLAAVAFATAAGNTINDIYDVDIDRVNKPRRPLPAGSLSVRVAVGLYIFCIAAAVCLLPFLPAAAALWIAAWVVLLHLYSWRLKRMYLAGNILVALVAGSGFLLGAFAGGDTMAGLIPAIFTFFFVMGREIVKDTDDLEGDRACKAMTFPVKSGRKTALGTALVIFLSLCVSLPLPSYVGFYRMAYGFIMLLAVVPVLLLSIWIILKDRPLGLVSTLLKVGMFFGCAAFYFGPRR